MTSANPSPPNRPTHKQRQVGAPPKPATISSPWTLQRSKGLQVLQLKPFKGFSWLIHGFSTRFGGASSLGDEKVLNLAFTDWDERENVVENRKRFQSAIAAKDFSHIPLKQIHSDAIRCVSTVPAEPPHADALTTDTVGLLLSVQTADCVPILLVDPKKRAVAVIHAGWRGTLARIALKSVGRMIQEYGSKPSHLIAAIGPSIGPCCYEVGVELVTQFTAQFAEGAEYFDEARTGDEPNPIQWLNMKPPGHQPPPKNVRLDLRKANVSQLKSAGLRLANIYVSDLCTACNTGLLFSYRKEGPVSGRLLAAVGMKAAKK